MPTWIIKKTQEAVSDFENRIFNNPQYNSTEDDEAQLIMHYLREEVTNNNDDNVWYIMKYDQGMWYPGEVIGRENAESKCSAPCHVIDGGILKRQISHGGKRHRRKTRKKSRRRSHKKRRKRLKRRTHQKRRKKHIKTSVQGRTMQEGRKAGNTQKRGEHTKAKFMFNDGTAVYSKYDKKYNKHDKGYVILGPPGIGKTTFVRNQKGSKKDWIDQDDLFRDLGVQHHFNNKNKDDFRLNYLRADYMSEQTKQLGYRIIGALFWEYKADAIVIIPEKLHKQYLSKRKDLNLKTVTEIIKYLREHAKKYNIPIFDNILDATKYLENLK